MNLNQTHIPKKYISAMAVKKSGDKCDRDRQTGRKFRQASRGVISVLLIGLYIFVMFTTNCLHK